MKKETLLERLPQIHTLIRPVRGKPIIIDTDLAELYGVPTFRFNEAVKRNRKRFPEDFMFSLTRDEWDSLRSQFAILNLGRGQHRKYSAAWANFNPL